MVQVLGIGRPVRVYAVGKDRHRPAVGVGHGRRGIPDILLDAVPVPGRVPLVADDVAERLRRVGLLAGRKVVRVDERVDAGRGPPVERRGPQADAVGGNLLPLARGHVRERPGLGDAVPPVVESAPALHRRHPRRRVDDGTGRRPLVGRRQGQHDGGGAGAERQGEGEPGRGRGGG